jgi:hypothetical protein
MGRDLWRGISKVNLVDAMSDDFDMAKRWGLIGLLIGMGIYVASLITVFLPLGADKPVVIILLLAQIFAFVARARMDEAYGCGEAVRRAAMLQDGLGYQPSVLTIANLCARRGTPDVCNISYIGPYYASQSLPGSKRLAEILLESAFWTGNLSSKTAKLLWCVVAGASILIVCSGVAFLFWGSQGTRVDEIARALLVSLSFWTIGDWASLALKYRVLAASNAAVLSGAEKFISCNSTNSAEALILFGEYNAALASAPPIPQIIYMHYQQRLNDAWSVAYGEFLAKACST